MSPTIRIDDEVYDGLKGQAEPFVDTPNTVLRRLLGLRSSAEVVDEVGDGGTHTVSSKDEKSPPQAPVSETRRAQRTTRVSKKSTPKRTRVPSGSVLPEEEYELPLLQALIELDGSAASKDAIELVGKKLEGKLTDLDRGRLNSGGIRWQSRVQFVRLRLVQQGLMVKDAGKGVWAISEAGRQYLQQNGDQSGETR